MQATPPSAQPLVIVLTGGIGCGKSTVAALFTQLGVPLVDTDQIAHQLTRTPSPLLTLIQQQFGPQALLSDGNLNRTYMRQLIFADTAAKQQYEGLLHPAIHNSVVQQLATIDAPYVLLAVPLYFETGNYRQLAQRVLVIDCTPEQQVARTMQRSGLSSEEVGAIMRLQTSRRTRLQGADDVIDNSGDGSNLAQTVTALHHQYLKLAQNFNKTG